ncbi:MAG: acyl-CoA desaturase [Planctomycetes bacterium]|nr:acyl-CoA desaturase [Planctomycetota bacterium]
MTLEPIVRETAERKRIDSPGGIFWENIIALASTHLLGLGGIAYCVLVRCSVWTWLLAAIWMTLCMLSVSAGYHRLFAHRTYRCAQIVRIFYLLFGAASGQASILRWAADHRVHHAHTDDEKDPYNVTKGFWWAHVGWLLFRGPPVDFRTVRDLQADPWIRVQDRFYLPIAVGVGMLLPTLIAWTWGDAVGGLLIAGCLRLMVQYQITFSVNSVAHSIGKRAYSTAVSARDSWLTALITMGEGYHNYHHRFPGDYRNGFRWYHFDPSKWWVWILSKVGLAWGLKRVPAEMVRKACEAVLREKAPAEA